jgi:hypothetical protein
MAARTGGHPDQSVAPAPARTEQVPVARDGRRPARPTRSTAPRAERPRRERYEARRVRRLIRHVDPWSVLKLALLLFVCLWLMAMIAAVIVWTVARGSGTIDKIESFANTTLGQDGFKFDGNFLFRQFGLIGLILALSATAAATVAAVVFNLISDIIGGVWITVIEEETARPVSGSPSERTLL